MGFAEAVSSGLSQYVGFSGRARRSEFWWFYLFTALVVVAGLVLDAVLGTGGLLYGLTVLGLFLPQLAVSVRRLHDIDRSGWAYLLYVIPFAGFILLIVFNTKEGQRGANRFGADPKGATDGYGYPPPAYS